MHTIFGWLKTTKENNEVFGRKSLSICFLLCLIHTHTHNTHTINTHQHVCLAIPVWRAPRIPMDTGAARKAERLKSGGGQTLSFFLCSFLPSFLLLCLSFFFNRRGADILRRRFGLSTLDYIGQVEWTSAPGRKDSGLAA